MKHQALGMIETRGLVAAIEAADIGVKAANVELMGYEIVHGGLVMIAFLGEVAAVKASVDAGSAAAEKIGTLISQHVIPRPEVNLRMVFKGKRAKSENDPPEPDPGGDGPAGKDQEKEIVFCPGTKQEGLSGQDQKDPGPESFEKGEEAAEGKIDEDAAQLEAMTVGALRRLARKTPGISIVGREISRANKEQLIREILRAQAGKD